MKFYYKMKFHVISDIHLEFYKRIPPITRFIDTSEIVDYLFICGDICDPFSKNYKLFLEECIKLPYKKVFIIAGNHEYYDHYTQKVTHQIRSLCKKLSDKLVFLHNSSYDIEDYTIIGSTLWSNVDNVEVTKHISDYKRIKDWTLERNNNENKKAIKFIERQLMRDRKFIIMTHHCPLIFEDTALSSAFYNNLYYLLSNTNILLWMFGHDHSYTNIKINNTRLISNQYGYPDESINYSTKSFDI